MELHHIVLVAALLLVSGCAGEDSTGPENPDVNQTNQTVSQQPANSNDTWDGSAGSAPEPEFVVIETEKYGFDHRMEEEITYTLEIANAGNVSGVFDRDIVFEHSNSTDMFRRGLTTDEIGANQTVRVNHTVTIPIKGSYTTKTDCCGPDLSRAAGFNVKAARVDIDDTVTTKDSLDISIGDLSTETSGNQEYTIFQVSVTNNGDRAVETPLYDEFEARTSGYYGKTATKEYSQGSELYEGQKLEPGSSISGTVVVSGNVNRLEGLELTAIEWQDESKPIGYIWEM